MRRARDPEPGTGPAAHSLPRHGGNIHHYLGRPGHEIVRLFEARLAEPSLYERAVIEGAEEDGEPLHCMWKAMADFIRGDPLYPEGLLDLLTSGTAR